VVLDRFVPALSDRDYDRHRRLRGEHLNSWLDQLHGSSAAFPPPVTAVKLAIALAIGLLIGFERQWSQKDFGVRTFTLTALLGALTAIFSAPAMLIGMAATILFAVLLNVRDIVAFKTVEGTTSVALVVTYVLGALSGGGHMFTSVACAIVTTWLLSLKLQFRQFATGLKAEEIRSAILLGLFGFVVWPLLPNRYVDPWRLLQPREAWVTVVVVACIGFVNYVLLRVYGKRGIALTAILGGLVNSTATAAELSKSLPAAGLLSQMIRAVLLTSVAMFLRNAVLLGIFGRSAVRFAVLPLLSMMIVAGYFAFRHREVEIDPKELELHLASPVSLKKVINFGILFLAIQMIGTLAVRWLGDSGVLLLSVIGGTASSASTTAAVANLVTHGNASALQAGTATILTSIASTGMNLPIVRRQIRDKGVVRELMLATGLQAAVGITVLFFEKWFIR
jgi:uncharacterized membrane protein (DUF4010 family)